MTLSDQQLWREGNWWGGSEGGGYLPEEELERGQWSCFVPGHVGEWVNIVNATTDKHRIFTDSSRVSSVCTLRDTIMRIHFHFLLVASLLAACA